MVRKIYVRDLREGEKLTTVFRVTRKHRNTGRSGKPFVALSLADKTGEVDARIFDKIDENDAAFGAGDYVLIEGEVITFHGKRQVVIARVDRLDPEPMDPKEFTPPAPAPEPEREAPREARDGHRTVALIREQVDRVSDPFVRRLLIAFLDDKDIVA